MALGLASWKLIGLEVMSLLQTVYFCVSLMWTLHPLLGPVAELYSFVNGYNGLFKDNPLYDFDEPPMRMVLTQMHIGARFLENINFMIIAELVVLSIGALLFVLSRLIQSKSEIFLKITKFILNEILFILVIFNAMNTGFSLGTHLLYASRPKPQSAGSEATNMSCALLALLITTASLYLIFKRH